MRQFQRLLKENISGKLYVAIATQYPRLLKSRGPFKLTALDSRPLALNRLQQERLELDVKNRPKALHP